ncbi:aspartate/glutamate racemase family protein [Thorsellia kenyensis]|uniref:Aspartate/glutamate racemase family protein n=1 Tax=Thorsellia kenyensis TaxID=1549888 RepID=A0ABV6C7L5_9GAMM
MTKVLLINPNSSIETLNMMVNIANGHADGEFQVIGEAAKGVPKLLTTDEDQRLAALEVVRIAKQAEQSGEYRGVIIAAYSDPGLEELQGTFSLPITGIGYASMVEVVSQDPPKPFVIVTTTSSLVDNLNKKVHRHGFEEYFIGVKIPQGDLKKITEDPLLLKNALKETCEHSFEKDGAKAAIIGGGPFAEIAAEICQELNQPVIAPIKSAVSHMKKLLKEN